jgi:hypothetical protein
MLASPIESTCRTITPPLMRARQICRDKSPNGCLGSTAGFDRHRGNGRNRRRAADAEANLGCLQLCRVSDTGPINDLSARAEGPVSESLQGRNPRGFAGGLPSMGI